MAEKHCSNLLAFPLLKKKNLIILNNIRMSSLKISGPSNFKSLIPINVV